MSDGASYSSFRVWMYCFTISLSSLYYGYNIGAFNGSMKTVAGALHWTGDEYTLYTTMFTSAFPLGAIFTTLLAGKAMEIYGRRRTLIIVAIAAIFVHGFSMIPTTWTFGIGRFMTGMLGGFATAIPPAFLNEVSPIAMSGRTGTLVQIMITFGLIIPGILCLPLPTDDYSHSDKKDLWMYIFGFPIIIMVFQLLMFFCVAKCESPKWLIKKGRYEEAKEFYQYIYTSDGAERAFDTAQAATPLTMEMKKDASVLESQPPAFTFKAFIMDKKFRKMLHLSVMLQVMQQWSGVNAIFAYSATMFEFSTFTSRIFSLVLSVVNFLATCLSIPLVGRMERKTLLVFGTLGCALSLAATGITSLFEQPYVSIVFVILFIFFFEQSLGPVVWIFCGEVFFDGAMGVSVMANWICCFTLLLAFPLLLEVVEIYVLFWVFAVICGLGVFYFWACVFETKDKTKEENQRRCMGDST